MFCCIRLSSDAMQYNGMPGYTGVAVLRYASGPQPGAELAESSGDGFTWQNDTPRMARAHQAFDEEEEEEEDLLPNIKRWMIPMPSDRESTVLLIKILADFRSRQQ